MIFCGNPLSRSAITGKADMTFCGAHVACWPKAEPLRYHDAATRAMAFSPQSSVRRYPSGNKATFHWTGDGFRGLSPVWRL